MDADCRIVKNMLSLQSEKHSNGLLQQTFCDNIGAYKLISSYLLFIISTNLFVDAIFAI